MSRKKFPFFKILIILILAGGIVFLWLEMQQEKETAAEAIKMPVRIVRPFRGDIEKTFKVSGFTESERMVTILPRVSGSLTEVSADMGDRIYKGKVVARLDSEPFALTLRQAEAAYLGAKSTFERTEQLYQAKATSKQNYDQAKSQFEAAQSQYELAKLNMSYTEITSPMEGIVLQKHAEPGELVAPQVPIITVGDLDRLIIRADIPERYYSFFLENRGSMNIETRVPALKERVLPGRIKSLSPYIVPETKTFKIVVTFSGEKKDLRPGMFTYLSFVLEERNDIFCLPKEVLISSNTLWYVDESSMTAKKINLTPDFSNGDYFEIGPEWENYPFIAEGQHFLREGQAVRIINEDS